MNELDVIEKELDSLIEATDTSQIQTFKHYIQDPNYFHKLPSREEVFKKAIQLEETVDSMSRDLTNI